MFWLWTGDGSSQFKSGMRLEWVKSVFISRCCHQLSIKQSWRTALGCQWKSPWIWIVLVKTTALSLEFCHFQLWISPGQGAQLHEEVKRTYWSVYSKHTNLFSGKDVPKKIWCNSLQMGEETTVPTITQQCSFSWAGGRALKLGAALSPLLETAQIHFYTISLDW